MPNANKLSQVAGKVAAATMRDEVALAVVNYFSLFYAMYEQTPAAYPAPQSTHVAPVVYEPLSGLRSPDGPLEAPVVK